MMKESGWRSSCPLSIPAWHESEMYLRWMAENMWIFVPAQVFTRQWLEFKEFPPVRGGTLGIDGVIKQMEQPAARQ
jgi:hypothetical protein